MGGNEGSYGRIVPECWLEWGLRAEGGLASTAPGADTLAAHDAVTTISRKAQQKVGKLVSRGRYAANTALLEQLPETRTPAGTGRPTRRRRDQGLRQGSL